MAENDLNNQAEKIPALIPLSKWNDFFQFPTVSALRQYVFYGEQNGFNTVIRRIGKRIYINVADFNNWVDSNTGTKACF